MYVAFKIRHDSATKLSQDHEAVPGDILTEIRTRLQHALGYKVSAGT